MHGLTSRVVYGRRVVISEPQAGRPEADKQLVIWCRLRYRSLGVKLCASERRAAARVRRRGPATCVQKAVAVWCLVPWELNRMCCSYRRDVMTEDGPAWLIQDSADSVSLGRLPHPQLLTPAPLVAARGTTPSYSQVL